MCFKCVLNILEVFLNMELNLIRQTIRSDRGRCLPKIMFSGHDLQELGFTDNTLVRVACLDDKLTFTASGIGMDAYKQVVGKARKNKEILTYVKADKKYVGGVHLTLASNWLKTNGFTPFDILMIKREIGCIKAKRLPLGALPHDGTRRLYNVTYNRKKSGKIPSIRFVGSFLAQAHFKEGTVVRVTCAKEMITLKLDQSGVWSKKLYGCPPPCKVIKQCTDADEPYIVLSGLWLYDFGFYPHDKIVVLCQPGVITIKRIDTQKLSF